MSSDESSEDSFQHRMLLLNKRNTKLSRLKGLMKLNMLNIQKFYRILEVAKNQKSAKKFKNLIFEKDFLKAVDRMKVKKRERQERQNKFTEEMEKAL
mmetsp:Transcript_42104/g.40361  ORF Transcript_42104/g.40361 Transcript_42104/m.40361 type:complete len:97 (+) Transcript_42104:219-509(+)